MYADGRPGYERAKFIYGIALFDAKPQIDAMLLERPNVLTINERHFLFGN